MAERILVVDDHLEMAEMLAEALAEAGFQAEALDSGARALERLEAGGVDALVTDLRMDGVGGMELLAASQRLDPRRPVIVMTAYGAIDTAVDSIRQGAYHYLTKPFPPEELEIFLRRALEAHKLQIEAGRLRKALREHQPIEGLVGSSPAMREVVELVDRLAVVDVPVLIQGETGTGKSLVAGAIHARSARAKGPFVSINCAALPEPLLESELFGHAKGAFTGATSERAGLFAEAEAGTLLLDEIGELPLAIQAKLLHVLERGSVRPVGSSRERPVDVRIIAATHRDLPEMARNQKFREDLLYRLDVVAIEIPALRHRREDILPLVQHFLETFRAKYPSSPVTGFTPAVMRRLMDHPWPGNVRELENAIERAILVSEGGVIHAHHLPPSLQTAELSGTLPAAGLGEAVAAFERDLLQDTLKSARGNRARAARLLRTTERILNYKIKKYDLEPERFKTP